ncbi:hypothetical protein [Azospirillum soli]|uniref:hypothetical protein n=1 Tax=Azospirillum soli TaxID=1304799 RepID=UPI001AEB7810|nr:hypothetical protein [Azospirillum soli]MBP2310741.1 hypothetical protein [Azospirillum soli]
MPEEGDAELLRLGKRHLNLLRRYEARDFGEDTRANDRFMGRLMKLENQIAAIPATTLAGLTVRLWMLWSWEATEPGVLFTGPTPEASEKAHLAWGLIKDAERVAARA